MNDNYVLFSKIPHAIPIPSLNISSVIFNGQFDHSHEVFHHNIILTYTMTKKSHDTSLFFSNDQNFPLSSHHHIFLPEKVPTAWPYRPICFHTLGLSLASAIVYDFNGELIVRCSSRRIWCSNTRVLSFVAGIKNGSC